MDAETRKLLFDKLYLGQLVRYGLTKEIKELTKEIKIKDKKWRNYDTKRNSA